MDPLAGYLRSVLEGLLMMIRSTAARCGPLDTLTEP